MFRKTVLTHALSLAFGAALVNVAMTPAVMAQSNATGNILGTVAAPAGATVQLTSLETGLKRTVTLDSSGRYQATALPVGRYRVELMRAGAVASSQEVEVLIGQGADASFVGGQAQTVQVTGRRTRIDVSNTTNGAIFTSRELARLPVAPSISAIIQLTPGTTRGDSRYGDVDAPSIGGASASENAFFINGFPVTNVLLQVGGSQLPFGAIGQAQILSGGYGAEFGRSTGGVSNITTKSGTNQFEFGAQTTWTPDALRSKAKNTYYPVIGVPSTATTDGKIYSYNEQNKADRYTYALYGGGPIIQDKLFFFFDAEVLRSKLETINAVHVPRTTPTPNGWDETDGKTTRGLLKLDWNITDNHRLEYTYMLDKPTTDRRYYSFDFNNFTRGTVQTGGGYFESYGPVPVANPVGAETNILKYTGNLTDDLTLTVLGGRSNVDHVSIPFGFTPGLAQVTFAANGRAPGLNYPQPQLGTGNALTPGAFDQQKVYRVDLEYKLGNHTIRAGLDHNDIASRAGTATLGGSTWNYQRADNPNTPVYPGASTPASAGGLGAQGYYVARTRFATISTPTVEQSAQYLEDRYKVTKDVLVSVGVRNEQFTNYNGEGAAYYAQRHQLAPRLGVSWDVNGDASLKVSGNAGRYHLQIPTNVAVRGAGSSLNTSEFFAYTGVDQATGAPTGLTPLSAVVSANNEFGQAVPADVVAAKNMKAHFQDEISFGFERAHSPDLNYGARATYRKLQSTVDDFCDSRPFYAYAARNNINSTRFNFRCALFNPGEDNTFDVEFGGPGNVTRNVTLTAAELGYPKMTRSYKAVDLFAEHPMRNNWYGKVNYTWSRSFGNSEGQLLSDIGQADVGTTQSFDYPEITLNSEGLLPNHREHQIKAFAFYQLTPEFAFGGNLLLASGRPKNCKGNLPPSFPSTNPARGYTSAVFFCNDVATPRGSQGNMPWDKRLDMNVNYTPNWFKGFSLKADIFNVTNTQIAQNIEERYQASATARRADYGRIISYTAPRSVRLSAEYNHKF